MTLAITTSGEASSVAPASLTFDSTKPWSKAQTVVVVGSEDGDADDGTAVLTHTASGSATEYTSKGPWTYSVSVTDDDEYGVRVRPQTVRPLEGRRRRTR